MYEVLLHRFLYTVRFAHRRHGHVRILGDASSRASPEQSRTTGTRASRPPNWVRTRRAHCNRNTIHQRLRHAPRRRLFSGSNPLKNANPGSWPFVLSKHTCLFSWKSATFGLLNFLTQNCYLSSIHNRLGCIHFKKIV